MPNTSPINVYRLSTLAPEAKAKLIRRAEFDISEASEVAARLVAQVRNEGDQALARHLREIDKVVIETGGFKVSESEFEIAKTMVDPTVKEAIDHSIRNVRRYHESQLPPQMVWHEVEPGVFAGEKISAIDSIGLYIPKGKGAFPSVMVMLGVPAMIAQVPTIAVCTPPNADGSVDAASLYAARCIGIDSIFKVGGASAIAALAFGTESVPKVAKILGPGNQYCSAAKRLLSSNVDVGLPAGPSESIILADETANPLMVAIDLLIEAEHGPDSSALLVTHSEEIARQVLDALPSLINELPEPRRGFCWRGMSSYGGIVITDSFDASIEFVSEYAPEHMELLTRNPFAVITRIRNAGEILIGPHTPISAGNYCIGVNAILPTGGFAKSHSCTSIHSFLKRTSLAYCTREGFETVRDSTVVLAEYEGFPAHANAVKNRPIAG